MIKVIPSGSYSFDEPITRLMEVHSGGVENKWFQKTAAVLTKEISELRARPDYSYLHVISLGAHEKTGANRNGDTWCSRAGYPFELPDPAPGSPKIYKTAAGLDTLHDTFLTGKVYHHHANSDTSLAIGDIKCAAWNFPMGRGELVLEVKNSHPVWADALQKLASGGDLSFSMAWKEKFDTCSNCGHQAASRASYCDCLKHDLSTITKSGNLVCAINDDPQGRFFDDSLVYKCADRICYALRKVASVGISPVIGGAELAERLGLEKPVILGRGPLYQRKLAMAHKLSEMEKKIEGVARSKDNEHLSTLAKGVPSSDMEDADIKTLKGGNLESVLKGLNEAKILLSVHDFLSLLGGKEEHADEVKDALPGVFGRLLSGGDLDEGIAEKSYDGDDGPIPHSIRELIGKLTGSHSLAAGPVQRRMTITIIRGNKKPLEEKVAQLSLQKMASTSAVAEALAREYAIYKIAFATAANDESITWLTALHCWA